MDRAVFRSFLLRGLEGELQYGKSFTHYGTEEDGQDGTRITAHFADGTSSTGALVVGADGVRSKVRAQHIPDFGMLDTNARCIYGNTPITDALNAAVPEHARSVMTVIEDDNRLVLFLEPVRFPIRLSASV